MTKKTIYNLIHKYRANLEKEGIPVTKVILFGSQAKGTAHKWSDIDVCVVSPLFGKDRHSERVMLMNQRLDTTIEPHPYSPDELLDPYDPLATEIRNTGVAV